MQSNIQVSLFANIFIVVVVFIISAQAASESLNSRYEAIH